MQYGLVLTLLTFLSLAMCPYGGSCCGTAHDTLVLYGIRVLSVLFGCTVPVLLSQLFMPWCVGPGAVCSQGAGRRIGFG